MKMKFPDRMRPPAGGPVWKWFSSLSRAEKSARADGGNIFRYLLILECLPRILLLPLGLAISLFPFYFLLSSLSATLRPLTFRPHAYVRQCWERFRSRSPESRDHRSNIKCQIYIHNEEANVWIHFAARNWFVSWRKKGSRCITNKRYHRI